MHTETTPFQDQLVRGLTHRMNNILTLFHGYLGLIMENQALDKPTLDGLAKIKEGAKAATELMDRTHALVRPSTVVWREVDLAAFVQSLTPLCESLRPDGARLEIVCEDDLPAVRIDVGRLKGAILELVRNACEAITPHGTKVSLEVRLESSGHGSGSTAGPWVTVSVIDDGPGIPIEAGERVFQPFFSTKKKPSSTGLGLNVASGYVQQLGGSIRHSSEPGHTVFEILLPAVA